MELPPAEIREREGLRATRQQQHEHAVMRRLDVVCEM